MTTAVAKKSFNWQVPSANDNEISIENYRAMVTQAETSGYVSYETHRRKFNDWFNEISEKSATQNA